MTMGGIGASNEQDNSTVLIVCGSTGLRRIQNSNIEK